MQNVFFSNVWKILHEDLLYPYQYEYKLSYQRIIHHE
jgi:hypothetical protein